MCISKKKATLQYYQLQNILNFLFLFHKFFYLTMILINVKLINETLQCLQAINKMEEYIYKGRAGGYWRRSEVRPELRPDGH